jgi:DNA-binding response OmpR family regulator
MPSSPIHILAVDDEPDLCALTKEFLERAGEIEVDTTGSVREARMALAKKHYDAILSDYQMPDENGIEFLKTLRAVGIRTPFILFTGKGREEVVIEALNCGADAYLQKGTRPVPQYAELEHRIRTLVQHHRAEEALRTSESRLQRAEEVAGFGHWQIDLNKKTIAGSRGAMIVCGLGTPSLT